MGGEWLEEVGRSPGGKGRGPKAQLTPPLRSQERSMGHQFSALLSRGDLTVALSGAVIPIPRPKSAVGLSPGPFLVGSNLSALPDPRFALIDFVESKKKTTFSQAHTPIPGLRFKDYPDVLGPWCLKNKKKSK